MPCPNSWNTEAKSSSGFAFLYEILTSVGTLMAEQNAEAFFPLRFASSTEIRDASNPIRFIVLMILPIGFSVVGSFSAYLLKTRFLKK